MPRFYVEFSLIKDRDFNQADIAEEFLRSVTSRFQGQVRFSEWEPIRADPFQERSRYLAAWEGEQVLLTTKSPFSLWLCTPRTFRIAWPYGYLSGTCELPDLTERIESDLLGLWAELNEIVQPDYSVLQLLTELECARAEELDLAVPRVRKGRANITGIRACPCLFSPGGRLTKERLGDLYFRTAISRRWIPPHMPSVATHAQWDRDQFIWSFPGSMKNYATSPDSVAAYRRSGFAAIPTDVLLFSEARALSAAGLV
jgi:hypothetical protein